MPKFFVVGGVDVTTASVEVEAETPEAAVAKAQLHARVCHQCSGKLNVGDIYVTRVYDEEQNEVYSDEVVPDPLSFPRDVNALLTMADIERKYIEHVLGLFDGNKVQAAIMLGLDRRTLYRKLDAWGTAERWSLFAEGRRNAKRRASREELEKEIAELSAEVETAASGQG